MNISFFNGQFLPHDDIKISPDDRGFLFADGIYEVVRWYNGFFFDMKGHLARLKRSLKETEIQYDKADELPFVAEQLILKNNLNTSSATVYIEITRGTAKRKHSFPDPPVQPTVYAFATKFNMDSDAWENGIGASLMPDIRWSRCDIKSIALLPNILSFQHSLNEGNKEALFVREGMITEGSHSNVFFVRDETLYTHPESNFILSGITRKNVIHVAGESGITVIEEAVPEDMLPYIQEAFTANTSGEITPVVKINNQIIGEGTPGIVTKKLQSLLRGYITGIFPG